jgi:hypothetical protein
MTGSPARPARLLLGIRVWPWYVKQDLSYIEIWYSREEVGGNGRKLEDSKRDNQAVEVKIIPLSDFV